MRLLRRGAVIEHQDQELGRHYYIHPFLFAVLTPQAVQTDWEAIEMRWISPGELQQYSMVPRLLEVYNAAMRGEEVID